MEKKILNISILIPTMNRPIALKRTLDGYMKGSCLPKQIVVVDQSAKPQDRINNEKILRNIRKEIDGIYLYQEEASSTKARNKAYSVATEEIIVYSDDDVDVCLDTLANIDSIMSNQNIAMIAGLDDNMENTHSFISYIVGTKSFAKRNIGHVTASMLGRFPNRTTGVTKTMWAMGFFFVIRKSFADKWKIRWDEKLTGYAYAEDLDYSYAYYKKALLDKMECIITPQVHVKHLATNECRILSRKSTFMYVLNRQYLACKHNMGLTSSVAMSWCNFWIYMSRIIRRDNSNDMKDAMNYFRRHKEEVLCGEFHY